MASHTGSRQPTTNRKISSKYDFVKVRVWLADHYYTFSRFLISRVLTVTQVSYADSLKISLALKKSLVDKGLLDITQNDMEEALFSIMRTHGYGEEYIARYQLMTRFNHRRVPLVIMVMGTGCVGKSTLATQLAERLNLSAVLQTDLVYEVTRHVSPESWPELKAAFRKFDSDEEFFREFERECAVVRGGLQGELSKVLEEGKSIIIEGTQLDPSLYHQLLLEDPTGEGRIWAPVLLTASDEEHQRFLDNMWHPEISTTLSGLGDTHEEIEAELKRNLDRIETYLQGKCKALDIPLLHMSVHRFWEVLESVQASVLRHIEQVLFGRLCVPARAFMRPSCVMLRACTARSTCSCSVHVEQHASDDCDVARDARQFRAYGLGFRV